MDDVLVTGATPQEHDTRLHHVLRVLQGAGLRLNKDKCKIVQEQVNFLGHRLGKDGIHPDPAKVDAILQMSPPTTKEEVKRLMGIVNWLSRFIPHAASTAAPINDLMKDDTEWTWGPAQRTAFRQLKTLLTTAPTLAYHDPRKPTMVSADASSCGVGGCILQKQTDESWKPVAYCSRSLTRAEQRYAQIEKELLAAVWSCERFYIYLRGLQVTLQTDHKPLVSLIDQKDLCDAPLHCQRLLMRLMKYNCYAWPATDAKLVEIAAAVSHDRTLTAVISFVKDGWPKYQKDVEPELRRFWEDQDNISLVGGILTYGDRIVILQSLRRQKLQRIHEGHQGISKSRLRANQALWWPELRHLHTTTAKSVINFMKATFARYGIPDVVLTDNGPQFLGEFDQFAREYNFQHLTSSPHYPQGNGQAEKAVHIAERLLSQDDPVRALMMYRSTPLPSLGQSPASLLMGRESRTNLPTLPCNLQPKQINYDKLRSADTVNKSKSACNFNRRHGARDLDPLTPGDRVKI
ncbi:uncharacterized protein LOC110984276 [Acanthaster planci]|uniref:Uncharacterized protein LOC110984276 n=1 Tax=Acanthaster planci TaxID=133434 RepID=A0A8B7Z2Y4_ACAPL|nr:uncharacterized protein LOC110984276 [Acanthaster planci]